MAPLDVLVLKKEEEVVATVSEDAAEEASGQSGREGMEGRSREGEWGDLQYCREVLLRKVWPKN